MNKREFTPEEIAKSLRVCFETCCGCGGCIYKVEPDLSSLEVDCRTDLVNIATGTIKAQAKRIGELEAELAKLREENRWIPVTERMPDVDGRYHCIVKSFAFPGKPYQALLFCDRHGFRDGNIYTDDVTHWKPMPKGPEVEHGR